MAGIEEQAARRRLVAANWKMNGRRLMAEAFAKALTHALLHKKPACDLLVCPPAPYLEIAGHALKDSGVDLGAQDCSAQIDGAFTGDVSAAMLKDMGCAAVILGHSERRAHHGETSQLIAQKMQQAHAAGLQVVLCVGEKSAGMSEETRAGILQSQLHDALAGCATAANTVIAYEPVWAIGSGLTPTLPQIAAAHDVIRAALPEAMRGDARILYGGSVNAGNAASILALPEVDGALVGGASLDAASFLTIAAAAG